MNPEYEKWRANIWFSSADYNFKILGVSWDMSEEIEKK